MTLLRGVEIEGGRGSEEVGGKENYEGLCGEVSEMCEKGGDQRRREGKTEKKNKNREVHC